MLYIDQYAFAAPFSPIDIPDALAWYDASNLASITSSSGAVSQIDDLTGNGYHLKQSSAGAKPTTGTRTRNSLNVLDFDGGDFMLTDSFNIDLTTAKEVTVAIVSEHDTSASNAGIVVFKRAGSYDQYNLILESQGTQYRTVQGSGSTSSTFSTGNFDTRGPNEDRKPLWITRVSTSDPTNRLDGSAVTTGDVGGGGTMPPSSWLSLGSGNHKLHVMHRVNRDDTDLGFYTNGAIAELIIYDRVLSDAECELLEAYLMPKWNVIP